MGKRLIALLLVAVLAFALGACGNDETTNNGSNDSLSADQADNSADNEGSVEFETDIELTWTHEVNHTMVQYCVNTPSSLLKHAGCGYKYEMPSYFIIYDQYLDISSESLYNVNLAEIQSPEDVIPAMSEQVAAAAKQALIYADEYTVEIITTENVKVNSWDMCKTTGMINLTCQWPLEYDSVNFVAYSVMKDGCPVYFMVVEDPTGDDPIDLEEMAYATALTFREHPDYE